MDKPVSLYPEEVGCCHGCGMMPTRGALDYTWECTRCRLAVWAGDEENATHSWNRYSTTIFSPSRRPHEL